MKKIIALIMAVLLSAPAISKEKKDYIVQNGDGTYTCSGSSAACAQINQQHNATWEQRDRERQQKFDRMREESIYSMREEREYRKVY